MPKAKGKTWRQKFGYSVNRKRLNRNARLEGGARIDFHIRQAWDHGKSVRQNLAEMGLAMDPNKAVPLRKRKKPASQKRKETRCLGTSPAAYAAAWWRSLGRAIRASEEAFVKESKEDAPGTEWEKVAQLCDFNPKSSKQCKDVSRLRSVLMSLKQTPLSR